MTSRMRKRKELTWRQVRDLTEAIKRNLAEYAEMHGQPYTYEIAIAAFRDYPTVNVTDFMLRLERVGLVEHHPDHNDLWKLVDTPATPGDGRGE